MSEDLDAARVSAAAQIKSAKWTAGAAILSTLALLAATVYFGFKSDERVKASEDRLASNDKRVQELRDQQRQEDDAKRTADLRAVRSALSTDIAVLNNVVTEQGDANASDGCDFPGSLYELQQLAVGAVAISIEEISKPTLRRTVLDVDDSIREYNVTVKRSQKLTCGRLVKTARELRKQLEPARDDLRRYLD